MIFKQAIREIQDFPEPGVQFKDITTLLKDGPLFRRTVEQLTQPFQQSGIDLVVGPEARGFVIGAPAAYALGAGFVPVRKPGKLPGPTLEHQYSLEYGSNMLQMHRDAVQPGQKVLIVDDLLATGGTIQAVIEMVKQSGGQIVGLVFLIELLYLHGRQVLDGYDIFSLIQYE